MDFSDPMNVWWAVMMGINAVSLVVYLLLMVRSVRTDQFEPENRTYKQRMRILGLIFVCVSLYRSMFVSSYPNRLAWVDSMANSPLIIRLMATCAEISYSLLVALPVLHMGKELAVNCRSRLDYFLLHKLPWGTVICLCTAQCFAYGGLITQHLTCFAIEETLWTLGFLCVAPAALTYCYHVFRYHRYDPAYRMLRAALLVLSVFTVGYLCYQCFFSLPFTYYSKLPADWAKPHLGFSEGIRDALWNFTVTRDFDTWGGIGFFIWHTGYFSICTWMNMLFGMAPRKLEQ